MQFATHIANGLRMLPHLFQSAAPSIEHERSAMGLLGSAALSTLRRANRATVFLVQGWADLATNIHPLAEALFAHGYQPVVFESPSTSGPLQSVAQLAEFADEIIAAAHAEGPIAAIVAHGEGASAALVALSRERFTYNAVLIGPGELHLSPELPAGLGDVRSLLIHSQDDGVVPLHDALELAEAWPNCMLSRVHGLGHQRILSSPRTLAEVLRFLDTGWLAGEGQ